MPSSRAATSAYAEKDEDSAIYEREGGVVRYLGAGIYGEVRMAARCRLAAPVRLCGGAAARRLGRACGGQM